MLSSMMFLDVKTPSDPVETTAIVNREWQPSGNLNSLKDVTGKKHFDTCRHL